MTPVAIFRQQKQDFWFNPQDGYVQGPGTGQAPVSR
jgi:hypothetical protein